MSESFKCLFREKTTASPVNHDIQKGKKRVTHKTKILPLMPAYKNKTAREKNDREKGGRVITAACLRHW